MGSLLHGSMRSLTVLFAASLLVAGACVPTPPITVIHVGKHGIKDDVTGDPVKFRRPAQDTLIGLRRGAYVIRGNDDWQRMWKSDAEAQSFPRAQHDPLREMMLLVATDDGIVSHVKIDRAVETAEFLKVFVRQTLLGEGCVRRPEDHTGFDTVITPRVDKPVKFYIEDEDAPSCGEPPKAAIGCRIAAAETWTQKVTAKAGDVVECELSTVAKGKYGLVDQFLTLQESPPGSNAKLSFSKGPTRATLALDAFGTYAVRAEATDEAGRRGRATALIEVVPKKTRDVLMQLTWNNVDATEPVAPLPRVLLRVTQEGPRGQRCSAEVPVPGLCEAKTRGPYTYMKVPASKRKLGLSVLYLDERAQSGPSPCVQVWFNGERTTTICDDDHRHAEDRWELGTLETVTGKVIPPKPPPEPKAKPDEANPAPAAGDAGAPAKPAPAGDAGSAKSTSAATK